MEPMKPVVGMEAVYLEPKCSLLVKILEYEELANKERFKFEVLKNLGKSLECSYINGEILLRERGIGENGLWSLVFDFK